MFDRHRPKLMTINEFAILAHTFLHEKRRPARHLHFHHNCHDHQYRLKTSRSNKATTLSKIHLSIITAIVFFYIQ